MRTQETGQSTLEYVALVALALVVLAAGAAVASAAGLAEIVAAQLARAVCVVGSGDCDRDRAPCVVASRAASDQLSVRLAVVRLSGGRTVLRERRSDGSEVVTLIERGAAGLETSIGAEIGIGDHVLGAALGGSAEGRFGHGRAWRVRDPAAADELLRRIAAVVPTGGRNGLLRRPGRAPPAPPAPDVVFGEHGMDAEIRGRLGVIGLRLDAEDLFGTRVERAGGERSFMIRRRTTLAGAVGLGAGPQGEGLAGGDEQYTLTVDARGRPLDLAVGETRRIQAGATLPRALRNVFSSALPPLRRGRLVQLERHLDLTEPANLAAAGAFIRAVRAPRLQLGDALAVSRALRARLDAAGTAQERVYAVQARDSGLHGSLSAGIGVGGGAEHSVESARLVAAATRGLDGSWRERGDCLRAARAL